MVEFTAALEFKISSQPYYFIFIIPKIVLEEISAKINQNFFQDCYQLLMPINVVLNAQNPNTSLCSDLQV